MVANTTRTPVLLYRSGLQFSCVLYSCRLQRTTADVVFLNSTTGTSTTTTGSTTMLSPDHRPASLFPKGIVPIIRPKTNMTELQHQNFATFVCLYTKHKTQKRKIWNDGKLVVNTRTCCVRLEEITSSCENMPIKIIPLSSVLDETELSKQQIAQLMQPENQEHYPMIEFEKYLVSSVQREDTTLPSTATSTKSVSAGSSTTGMQKLLTRKFQPPLVPSSKYRPPQELAATHFQKRQRAAPLQPGELEQRYYNSISLNGNTHTTPSYCQQLPNSNHNPHSTSGINKDNAYINRSSIENRAIDYPVNTKNPHHPLHQINNSSNRQNIQYLCNDAPHFDPLQFYGEEDNNSDESSEISFNQQQEFVLFPNINPQQDASSKELQQHHEQHHITINNHANNTNAKNTSNAPLSRLDLLNLFGATQPPLKADENITVENCTATSVPVLTGSSCFDKQANIALCSKTDIQKSHSVHNVNSSIPMSSIIEADLALDDTDEDETSTNNKLTQEISEKGEKEGLAINKNTAEFHFSLPTADSSSGEAESEDEDTRRDEGILST